VNWGGDHEDAAAGVLQGAVEAAAPVIEDPQGEDLRRDALAVLGPIVGRDAEQHGETGPDRRDGLLGDVNGSGAHTLYDRAHRRRSCLVQHPGIVPADDRLDFACGEVTWREHRHALVER